MITAQDIIKIMDNLDVDDVVVRCPDRKDAEFLVKYLKKNQINWISNEKTPNSYWGVNREDTVYHISRLSNHNKSSNKLFLTYSSIDNIGLCGYKPYSYCELPLDEFLYEKRDISVDCWENLLGL